MVVYSPPVGQKKLSAPQQVELLLYLTSHRDLNLDHRIGEYKHPARIIKRKLEVHISYFLILGSSGTPTNNDNILSTNLYSHNSLALHIHPHLEIEINGQKEIIPINVGISGSVMRVIHTHDDTGKLHVESPVPHTFVLQDFFTIWGKTFSGDCIFEYCTNGTHELRVTVNGQPSAIFGEIPLKDLDNIKVVYGPKA